MPTISERQKAVTIDRTELIKLYEAMSVELLGIRVNAVIMLQGVCRNDNGCAELYVVTITERPTTWLHNFPRAK
jgi:hypothetical protein